MAKIKINDLKNQLSQTDSSRDRDLLSQKILFIKGRRWVNPGKGCGQI
jgi:hypothetical protein